MDAYTALAYIVLGGLLGAVGQGARMIVGTKKVHEEATASGKDWKDLIELKRLMVSLIIGGIAGILGAVFLLGAKIDKEFLITLIAIGYAGTDFIEGIIRKAVPK